MLHVLDSQAVQQYFAGTAAIIENWVSSDGTVDGER